MPTNPTAPPFGQVNEALKNFESTRDLASFLTAFEIALENRIERQQFQPIIENYIGTTPATVDDVEKVLRWAERFRFKKIEPVVSLPTRLPTPEFQAILDEARRIGAAIGSADREAEDHLYWFFRPAWQVKSALWSELFGEHDPAIAIARYAKHSFKSSPDVRTELSLGNADILIITSLVDHLKSSLLDKKIDAECARAILAAAVGAEHLFPDKLLKHFPFGAVFASATSSDGIPHWIAQYALQFWDRSIDDTYGNNLSGIDAAAQESLLEQVQLVASVLLAYVMDDDDSATSGLPRLEYISDRSFTAALHTIDWLNTEMLNAGHDIPELQDLLSSVIEATDRARVRRFGGRFPFSIYDASSLYGQANLETWISQIARYTSDIYDDWIDPYSCTYSQNARRGVFDETRVDRLGLRRYGYYRKALDEFTADGLEELASAWWSFFIASQILTFGNLAVPPSTLKEVLQIASRFKSDPGLMKAVRYAAASIPEDTDNVIDMAAQALLRNFIRGENADTQRANILQLGRSREQIRDFLKAEIGPEIWESLSELSQKDLIDAEQLWTISHFELGTKKREDWGAIVVMSARPIEAELRDRLKGMFDQIERETGEPIKERTLGGCLKAIRAAAKSEKLSPPLATCVSRIATFAEKHSSIDFYRNWAAHAERGRPISAQDLLKWRMIILKHGIFEIIVKTARDFRTGTRS
jgi:hypothetical protein